MEHAGRRRERRRPDIGGRRRRPRARSARGRARRRDDAALAIDTRSAVTRGEQHEGKLRLLVVAADGAGGTSPIRQVEIPLTVDAR